MIKKEKVKYIHVKVTPKEHEIIKKYSRENYTNLSLLLRKLLKNEIGF